ncbi:MAG: histidinol phosphatase [Ruminococcaceae bacterium]|nr:histidinol phosphatase [Oscillospiraceae bacterium]
MYKYETHLHTSPVSRCARVGVRETLEFYKSIGYDGVFITNHFLDGNINIDDHSIPYEEKINFYFSDYEAGLELAKEIGIKVFPGVELSYGGTDFLVYGLDKEWYLNNPQIMEMKKTDELTLMMECGALIIQAHPYREASYIDHIRLFPRHVHGIEIINANRKEEENAIAEIYAKHYGLLTFAGSDNHAGAGQKKLAGVCTSEPICSVEDFINKVKSGETEIFTLANE